jgi:AcrR family transcriptional regulator
MADSASNVFGSLIDTIVSETTMPDNPHPDPRHREIADAVLSITARAGLEAVSMRSVAAEAGCSLGLVQRLMGTKDALLSAAMARIIERVEERLDVRADAALPVRAVLDRLFAVLLADEYHEEGLVWGAFLARALVSPALAAEACAQQAEAEAAVAFLLRTAADAGELVDDAEPERDALALLALADGLGTHMLLGHCDGATARAALAAQLDRLFRRS